MKISNRPHTWNREIYCLVFIRTNMTNASVCLSVIQSKLTDVNPLWPSLFVHFQKPGGGLKSWNQLAHSHSQLCAFVAQSFWGKSLLALSSYMREWVHFAHCWDLMVEGKQGAYAQVHPSFIKEEKESRNGLVDCRSSSRHCEPVIGDLWPLLGVERRRAGQPFNSSNTKWYEMIWN